MDTYLNLSQAADLLAELTNNPRVKNDIVRIIMLGAESEIAIFWRNPLHVCTRISSTLELLPKNELEPLPGTDAGQSWLQLPDIVLCDLEIDQQRQCWTFEIDEEDIYDLIGRGETVFTDLGMCKWFRHTADFEDLTIDRNQLFVVEHHLREYAATLAPATEKITPPKPNAADIDQVQPTPPTATWHLHKPKRDDGLAFIVYDALKKYHDAGQPKPTGGQLLADFKSEKPNGILSFTDKTVKFAPTGTGDGTANAKDLSDRIRKLTTPEAPK